VLTQLSCSSLGRQDKNLAAIQCIFKLSFKMLRTDPNEIPNMLATSQIVVLLLQGTFPSLHPYILCFSQKSMSQAFGIFSRDHATFEHRNPFKNFFSSQCVLSKTTIKSLESFCGAFPHFKAKFDECILFYQGCHFLRIPKSQMEPHTLLLKRQHSAATSTTDSILQAGNGAAGSIWN
jgi:hypothetical protein